jgi:hypothetical protein
MADHHSISSNLVSSDPLSLGREGAGMVLVQVLGSDKHPLVRKVHMI